MGAITSLEWSCCLHMGTLDSDPEGAAALLSCWPFTIVRTKHKIALRTRDGDLMWALAVGVLSVGQLILPV